MSTVIGKRKRARQACIPCHRRKRKCDGKYPCHMCVAYEYDCRYGNDSSATADSINGQSPRARKRVTHDGILNGARPREDSQRNLGHSPTSTRTTLEAEASSKDPSTAGAGSSAIGTSSSIFDEQRLRYAGSSAAMAFPHVLSLALGFDGAPKMHSFAYNFGLRPEEASSTHGLLSDFISETDLDHYSDIYFSALGPIGDFIDPRIYAQRCRDYYQGLGSMSIGFAAVAAGIAALGSFLSSERYSRESDLVQYAKGVLDDPVSLRALSIDIIVASSLRVFYLRATSRPNNAWLASCTVVHLCEAAGLHEEQNIKKIASVAGAAALGHDEDRLRRIFWITWAGHNMLSYESARSSVHLPEVTCRAILPISGSVADQFVRMAQIIPAPNSPFRLEYQPSSAREELFERLKALDKLHFTHPFLIVSKADLCFGFYRRIYQLKMGISDEISQLIMGIGLAAIDAAEDLASQARLFWNVIGSVFQFACVLIAIDSPSAATHIPTVMKGLETLVNTADTRPTRKALAMAQHLLSLSLAKKRSEIAQLEPIEARFQNVDAQSELGPTIAATDFGWDLDWDQFLLEPYISMLSNDIQLN